MSIDIVRVENILWHLMEMFLLGVIQAGTEHTL